MQKIAIAARRLLIALALIGIGAMIVANYSFVFSRNVKGEVVQVERVTEPSVFGRAASAAQIYSFAVAVKASDGEIVTASTEDRQWAVVKEGFCVEARFYPYPPWDLEKGGTYFNARLLKMRECEKSVASAAKSGPGASAEEPASAEASSDFGSGGQTDTQNDSPKNLEDSTLSH